MYRIGAYILSIRHNCRLCLFSLQLASCFAKDLSCFAEWLISNPHGSTGGPRGLCQAAPTVQYRDWWYHTGSPHPTACGSTLWPPPHGQSVTGQRGEAQLSGTGERETLSHPLRKTLDTEGVFNLFFSLLFYRMASLLCILLVKRITCVWWISCWNTLHH